MRTREAFGDLLNDLDLVGAGAEIGVFRGAFAEQILLRWRGSRLYLIDPWRHLEDYLDSWNASDNEAAKNLLETRLRLKQFGPRVEYLRLSSLEASNIIANGSLDFAYIDANHSYLQASADLAAWFPKIRNGGIFAGHDYFNAIALPDLEPDLCRAWADKDPSVLTSYGVKAAVDDFTSRLGLKLHITKEEIPTWWLRKF